MPAQPKSLASAARGLRHEYLSSPLRQSNALADSVARGEERPSRSDTCCGWRVSRQMRQPGAVRRAGMCCDAAIRARVTQGKHTRNTRGAYEEHKGVPPNLLQIITGAPGLPRSRRNVSQASRLRAWAASRRHRGQRHRVGRPANPQARCLRHVLPRASPKASPA
jgi:hypothetical protein